MTMFQTSPPQPALPPRRACAPLPSALLLLSGTVRPTPFSSAIGRSLLDLPVDERRTVLDLWRDDVGAGIEVRILCDHATPLPAGCGGALRAERDPFELRGTGGILRDVAARYADEDFLMVAGGAQLLTQPFTRVLDDFFGRRADVVVSSQRDGTPSSLMLVRCRCLRMVPAVGFIDMKEQALPLIARRHLVVVRTYDRPLGLPLRTESQYIAALRWYHRRAAVGVGVESFDEDWEPSFSIVEEPSDVDPGAIVHDSVVLRGGRVQRGGAVVRSVVCKGASVRRDAVVTDSLIAPGSK